MVLQRRFEPVPERILFSAICIDDMFCIGDNKQEQCSVIDTERVILIFERTS